jgi:phospholipid/cholesterol/gamma-HCH transport system substrate-binding protein
MPSAARVKWAEFRVAVVSIAALAILSVLLYLLLGGSLLTEKAYLYVYIPDATGLGPSSPVRVDGVTVGKVAAVDLSGSKDPQRVVRVTLVVARSVLAAIPPGSYVQLSFEDPVGNKYIDITSRGSGQRQPYSEIPFKEQTDFLKSLDLAQFEKQLRDVDAVLSEIEAGKGRVGQLVLGTQIYSDLRKRLGQIEHDVRAAASTQSSVGEALYTDKLYRQMTAPVVALDQALAKIQSGQGAGLYLRDSAQYDQLRTAMSDLGSAIAGLRNDPLLQSDELYRQWTSGVVGMIQSVDQIRASPMFANSPMYDNLNGFAKELRDNLRDFREHPSKYLRMKVF